MFGIVEILGISIILSFLVAWFTKMIDFGMQYGHLFGGVRLYFAKRAFKKAVKGGKMEAGWLNKEISMLSGMKHVDVVDRMDDNYEYIANHVHSLKLWICQYCLAARIGVFVGIIAAVIGCWLVRIDYLAMFMLIPILTYFFIEKSNE